MIGILVMLNNYFHDFATSLVLVCSYSMVVMVRYVEQNGGMESKRLVVHVYPKVLHINVGATIFVFMAGIVRTFTYSEFEWYDAAGKGQVVALIIKHILLVIAFSYGVYLWVGVHRKIKAMRKELRAEGQG